MLDFTKRYKSSDYEGVAVYLVSYAERYDEVEEQMVDDPDFVFVTMVGDDRRLLVGVDTLTEITDEDYCSDCGQTGCGW